LFNGLILSLIEIEIELRVSQKSGQEVFPYTNIQKQVGCGENEGI
jgi:hypothetical protein